jgi:hypothetical protein
MVEPFRLVGDAVGDLLDVAGDVGELDPEAADAVGKLVDQPFGERPVGSSVHDCKLGEGHLRAFSNRSRSPALRGIPIPTSRKDVIRARRLA